MATRRWAWVAVAIAAAGLAACGDSGSSGGGSAAPGACTPPTTLTRTFRADVYPIFTTQCTPCHTDAQAALPKFASIDPATAYSATRAFVDPSNAASSLLVQNPTGHNGHPDQLNDAQAATITQWIRECATDGTRDTTASTTTR
jgi:hypothetical protein